MNLFVQSTLILIQWVSGICIFMLFYIWLFKKYENPKCHIFTIYYAIIGFSFISEIVKSLFPQLQSVIRFSMYFVMEPLSILVLAFFISNIVLNKKVNRNYFWLAIGLLILHVLPHLPYNGAELYNPMYEMFYFSIIGAFGLTLISVVKMIRDYGLVGNLTAPPGLWWFLGVSYVHKTTAIIFSGAGLNAGENSTYSAILMLMVIFSFVMLLKVFYETIVRDRESINAAISKSELLAKEEDELVQYIYQYHPEIVRKFDSFGITDRELAIIVFTMFGISLKECADYFNVSTKTIEQYRYRLKKKIGLEDSLAQSLSEMKFGTF